MSKFLSNITARIFFRIIGFLVVVLSIPLWYYDKLSTSQLTYLLGAVVFIYVPRKFAMKIFDVLINRFKNKKDA